MADWIKLLLVILAWDDLKDKATFKQATVDQNCLLEQMLDGVQNYFLKNCLDIKGSELKELNLHLLYEEPGSLVRIFAEHFKTQIALYRARLKQDLNDEDELRRCLRRDAADAIVCLQDAFPSFYRLSRLDPLTPDVFEAGLAWIALLDDRYDEVVSELVSNKMEGVFDTLKMTVGIFNPVELTEHAMDELFLEVSESDELEAILTP